ncbi:MAG: gliding motility lipoprotein GldH [Bacteroidetes bacterium]|nr:gliding motility lipoprotein GldH [Bacteroidota bacterium]
MRFVLLISLLSITLFACNSKTLIDDKAELPSTGWTYDNIPSFPFVIEDTSICYNVSVNLQITDEYLYRNIYLLVHLRDPEGKDVTNRVELDLATVDGKWTGSGSGNYKSYYLPISKDLCLKKTGRYIIGFEQNMRDTVLQNVKYVGAEISKGNPVF